MANHLFTLVCEFEGGTYASQVEAHDVNQAVREWGVLLARERPMGTASDEIASAIVEDWDPPVPLEGLVGVWCWTESIRNGLVLTNIIRTV